MLRKEFDFGYVKCKILIRLPNGDNFIGRWSCNMGPGEKWTLEVLFQGLGMHGSHLMP